MDADGRRVLRMVDKAGNGPTGRKQRCAFRYLSALTEV